MNSQVFDALSAVKVVTAPDPDLVKLLNLQTQGSDVVPEDEVVCRVSTQCLV